MVRRMESLSALIAIRKLERIEIHTRKETNSGPMNFDSGGMQCMILSALG